jgi:type I restriction enzyme M protein
MRAANPQPGQRICDPACGTAGFLISAFTYILRQHTKSADLKRGHVDGAQLKPAQWRFLEEQAFTGYENDANMVKISILNLYLHRLEKAHIEMKNALTTGFGGAYPGRLFDVILANPPFAGRVQEESILSDLNYKLNTRATELLFLKWFIDHLAPNGRAGVIVPNGVLFGSTNAASSLREMLLTQCDLQAVINLPSGVFKPYSGVTIEGLSSVHCKNAGGIEAKILVELKKQAIRHSQREGKAMDVIRLPQSFRRTAILEAAALIILTGLVIAFVHSVVPYIAERL